MGIEVYRCNFFVHSPTSRQQQRQIKRQITYFLCFLCRQFPLFRRTLAESNVPGKHRQLLCAYEGALAPARAKMIILYIDDQRRDLCHVQAACVNRYIDYIVNQITYGETREHDISPCAISIDTNIYYNLRSVFFVDIAYLLYGFHPICRHIAVSSKIVVNQKPMNRHQQYRL